MGDPPRPPADDGAAVRHGLDEAARGRLDPCVTALVAAGDAARPVLELVRWFAGESKERPFGADDLCARIEAAQNRPVAALALAL